MAVNRVRVRARVTVRVTVRVRVTATVRVRAVVRVRIKIRVSGRANARTKDYAIRFENSTRFYLETPTIV